VQGSFRLFRIAGVDIEVHWSWLLVFVLLTWTLATGLFDQKFEDWSGAERWVAASATSIVFFGSILAHELSHSIMANRLGIPVRRITLFVFGGVSHLEGESRTPREEFLIAIAGPAASFAIAALLGVLAAILLQIFEPAAIVAAYLGGANAIIGVFNLIPGFPLDGGRVLRALLWKVTNGLLRATRLASWVGTVVAYGLMALGIVLMLLVDVISGLWLVFIGWFLRNAAESSYQQVLIRHLLGSVPVRALVDRSYEWVAPDMTLQILLDEHILPRSARCFAVTSGLGLGGIITVKDVRRFPKTAWPSTTVAQAMTPADRLVAISPERSLDEALHLMGKRNVHQLPVMENGTLVGFVTRADILRTVQMRVELGAAGQKRETAV
jgi:Zn-dependent protease/CBS domain-containing protein